MSLICTRKAISLEKEGRRRTSKYCTAALSKPHSKNADLSLSKRSVALVCKGTSVGVKVHPAGIRTTLSCTGPPLLAVLSIRESLERSEL